MNEEEISSNSIETLISFVGIREYLISEFIKSYLYRTDSTINKIILFISERHSEEDSEIPDKSWEILNKIIQAIKDAKPGINIEISILNNIWDIKSILAKLSEIKTKKASVNITAGPSSFSTACLLWAVQNGHFIEHSVEAIHKNTGRVVVFRRINIIPYFNTIFKIDNTDRQILDFLKTGSSTTNKIRSHLKEERGEVLTLRTIENRIVKMNELGIISITHGRFNTIDLSDEFKKLS